MITALKTNAAIPQVQAPKSEAAQQFEQADFLINTLDQVVRARPEAEAALREMSSGVKESFRQGLTSLSALPTTPEEAHQVALQALAAGLLGGALDGVLAFVPAPTAPAPAPPAPAPAPPAPPAPTSQKALPEDLKEDLKRLQEALDQLMADLGRAASEAAARLKTLGPRALQMTSKGQKAGASMLVDQAVRFPRNPSTPLLAWQTYLTTVFALGYGVAINDAALIVLAGQQPQG